MRYPKPEIDRETAMKLWIEEHSDYAKEQVFLNNTGIIGIVMKSLKLNPYYEDLAQTAAEGLVTAINTYSPKKGFKFSNYSMIVIRNKLLNSFKKKRISQIVSLDYTVGDDDSDSLWDFIPSGERFEDLSVMKIDLEKSMSRLRKKEQQVLHLLICGETQSSIAEKWGTSRQNIRRILISIRKKIGISK